MGNSLAMATITARSSSLADKIIEDISKDKVKKESVPTDDVINSNKDAVTKEVAPLQKNELPKDSKVDANKDVIQKEILNEQKPDAVKKDIITPEKQVEPAVPVSE